MRFTLCQAFVLAVVHGVHADLQATREDVVKVCHHDTKSGMMTSIDLPEDFAARFMELNKLDFIMEPEAEKNGCCAEGCEANCGRKLGKGSKSSSDSSSSSDSCDYNCCCSDYGCTCDDDDYRRNLSVEEANEDNHPRRNRKLCIEMECCADVSGGPPKCVPAGTCKLIHDENLMNKL
mmetsp:Transcript_24120/g.48843  ORF Transcript_24120/g.48843 Transcript_24120/m.48843 type:complete len:178 (-) Transcript_24120:108-641(-)